LDISNEVRPEADKKVYDALAQIMEIKSPPP